MTNKRIGKNIDLKTAITKKILLNILNPGVHIHQSNRIQQRKKAEKFITINLQINSRILISEGKFEE
jgi:hypothetical protein